MSATELVGLLGILVAIGSSIVVPISLDRRKTRAAESAEEDKNTAELAATNVVSWQSITAAIQKERDTAVERARTVALEYAEQLAQVKAECAREIAQVKTDCARDLKDAKRRIHDLETEVLDLHRQLRNRPPA